MDMNYVEKVIARKTERVKDLVKGGMGVTAAKDKVLAEKELVNCFAKEIIRRRINSIPHEDLKPKPKTFWSWLLGT